MTQLPEPDLTLVIETHSVHEYDDISFEQCLRAIANLDYPEEKMQTIVIDGGNVSNFDCLVPQILPRAELMRLHGGTKFQQKNLGVQNATGNIICFVDGDCAPPRNWLRIIVEELNSAPEDIAGIQGSTRLTRKNLSREVSGLLYGVRTNSNGRYATRLVTDNCAFRREILQKYPFEQAHFSTVVDTLLMVRLRRAGCRMYFSERLTMQHSFPGWNSTGMGWFFGRAYGVGYYMVHARRIEKDLRGSSLVRPLGIGWPLLFAGKTVLDLKQLWQNRKRLQLSFLTALPLTALYEAALFCGGCAAVFNRRAPQWS